MRYSEKFAGKLFRYFVDGMGLKKSTKGYFRGDCPLCGSRFTFGVNIELGKSNCFKCSEAKTNLLDLVKICERLETYQEVKNFLNLQEDYEFLFKERDKKKIITRDVELPEHYHLITQGDNIYARAARHYLRGRDFNINRLSNAGVGYCDDGKYEGYIILPYFVMGKLVYFNARRYMGSGPKFNNPPEEEYGVGKTTMLYNQDALFMYRRCYLVESVTNALTLGVAAVGTGGKAISAWQLSMVIKSPVEKLIILLDPDALKEAYYNALQLVHYKNVKVGVLPNEFDVNLLGKLKTLEIVKSTNFENYNQLYKNYQRYKDVA